MELENKNFNLEIRSVDDAGVFSGYGSVFNVKDAMGDIVYPGAFVKSITKKMPVMLWQHNSEEPIGIYTDISEDGKGLKLTGKLLIDEVQKAREAYALLKANAIRGLSIGYIPLKYDRRNDEKGYFEGRDLKEIDLWEVSLVTFPANPKAIIGNIKNFTEEKALINSAEKILRMLKGDNYK